MDKEKRLERIGTFRISTEVWDRLSKLASKDERPVSHLARKAIEQYLNRRESPCTPT